MAIAKKGSRKIVVNEVQYYWRFKQYKEWCPCCNQGTITIIVEKKGGGKPLLAKIYHEIYPEKYALTPKYIRKLIFYGIDAGWDREAKLPHYIYFDDFNELFAKLAPIEA